MTRLTTRGVPVNWLEKSISKLEGLLRRDVDKSDETAWTPSYFGTPNSRLHTSANAATPC